MKPAELLHVAIYSLEEARRGDFAAWYEGEHAREILARPGWRRLSRYECTDGQPFVSLYELDDDLPTTPTLSAAPFRSGLFAARGLRDYHARTWRQIRASGSPPRERQWLNVVTVDIEEAYAEAFNDWYNDVHVPEILGCPGWLANRRYESVDGEPRFLAIYDLSDPTRPFQSPEWDAAVGWDEHANHIRGLHGFRVYRLIFDSA